MDKIIFLDIDGVLNNEQFYIDRHEKYESGELIRYKGKDNFYERKLQEFDPKCIALLNQLLEETKAEIVISSTWRVLFWEELPEIFKRIGIKQIIKDRTPRLNYVDQGYTGKPERGSEIKVWLENNGYQRDWTKGRGNYKNLNYVIFDDDSDMLLEQKDYFICIDPINGLEEEHIQRAIKILNGE